jgi:hypothetical protein
MAAVTPTAAYLFLTILASIHEAGSKGRITAAQVRVCVPTVRNQKRYLVELVQAKLLKYQQDGEEFVVADPDKWLTPARECRG